MEEEILNIEKRDGIRLTWNVWPSSGNETAKLPLACLYNVHQAATVLEYEPILCGSCKAVLNPHCNVDFGRQSWACVICNNNNMLPSHARDITPENLLPELLEENTTVEYVLGRECIFPSVFFFIVDLCTFDEERHKILIDALKTTLKAIPDDCLVGFLQYGTNIELLELNKTTPRVAYLFSGKKEYTTDVLKTFNNSKSDIAILGKFLKRKDECVDFLSEIFENLGNDPFPVLNAYKPVRCTGSAVSLAVSLLEKSFPETAVKYLLFTQGPCTFGPGTVTAIKYKEKGKNEHIEENDPMYLGPAEKFYTALGNRMNAVGHSLDILSTTIVDIGITQMSNLCSLTGGMLIMAQDFDRNVYITSCEKIMEANEDGSLKQGFNAKVQVRTSQNLDYKGVLGMGAANGTVWKIGSIFPSSNISILLDKTAKARNGDFGFVQIATHYQRSDKKMILKVTTFARIFTNSLEDVLAGFDQEAAAVLQARVFLMKKYEEVKDSERMIDKNLIRFTKSFAKFDRGVPSSLVLHDSMAYFPNYMFFFRRSLLIQTGHNSFDETTYYRHLLYKEQVSEALKLMKPTLLSYHYQGEVKPVEVDAKSIQPDVILLLDTFHNVLIWRGGYISQWIKEGYHEQEEYSFLKDILEKSESRAKELCKRLPTPQFCITEQDKSQQRILHHYVNPSGGASIITENISFEKFFEALCKVVVFSED